MFDWSLLIYLGNILRVSKELQENNEEDFDLKLIDFEFSAYNYRWISPYAIYKPFGKAILEVILSAQQ